ncbi:MAG: D-aminoacyl-tRNA deacylase [Candidatus Heimdallarchaeaceae archaeon]
MPQLSRIVLVFPVSDIAAQSMWRALLDHAYFAPTTTKFDNTIVFELDSSSDILAVHSSKDGVFSNHIDSFLDTDLIIFASRHSAASGKPALLVHPPGNWGEPTLGGASYELAYTSAYAIKQGLMNLKNKKFEYNLEEYSVNLEVTHHGPTSMKAPTIFMELGSNEEYWKDQRAALAVGEAIINTAKILIKSHPKGAFFIGIGGNHYAYRFHKFIEENDDVYIGHIIPKHNLDYLTLDSLMQAINKTIEPVKGILIDKKGTRSSHRDHAKELATKVGIEFMMI